MCTISCFSFGNNEVISKMIYSLEEFSVRASCKVLAAEEVLGKGRENEEK